MCSAESVAGGLGRGQDKVRGSGAMCCGQVIIFGEKQLSDCCRTAVGLLSDPSNGGLERVNQNGRPQAHVQCCVGLSTRRPESRTDRIRPAPFGQEDERPVVLLDCDSDTRQLIFNTPKLTSGKQLRPVREKTPASVASATFKDHRTWLNAQCALIFFMLQIKFI